ncbi:MAG TPA: cation transporter [Candidatus Saccharimonadia bacterium]
MITQTFSVPDMNCTACVMHIEAIEDEIDGIACIDASYKKLRMVVEYDETKISPDAIVAAVKETGYTAIPQEMQA